MTHVGRIKKPRLTIYRGDQGVPAPVPKEQKENNEKMAPRKEIRLETDPSVLPPRVTESIFKLLPIEDVLSCCLVSSSWRNAVNTDTIWKPFCNLGINLDSVRSVKKRQFEYPQNEHLTLVCGNRLKYMREIHLRNNFKQNRFVKYQICGNSCADTSVIQFFNNNRYILLNDLIEEYNTHYFEVWDIEHNEPPTLVQIVPHLLTKVKTDLFISIGDSLLIIQGNLFQLYRLVDGNLSLILCRILNKKEDFSQHFPSIPCIEAWYYKKITSKYPGFESKIVVGEIVDQYLIVVFKSLSPSTHLNTSVFHLWDWTSGKKLKIESLPNVSQTIECLSFKGNCSYLYIGLFLEPSSGARCKLYSYELKQFKYTQLYLVYDYNMYFMNNGARLVVFPSDKINIFKEYMLIDPETGNVIVHKETGRSIYPWIMDSYNSLMAFSGFKVVTIVDLHTQSEVAVLQVNFIAKQIYFIDSNLILVTAINKKCYLEVWDIKKNCRLYKFKNTYLIDCGRPFLRLCVNRNENVEVLNYW